MKIKRALIFILTGLVCMYSISGCTQSLQVYVSGKNASLTANGEYPIVKNKTDLSVMVHTVSSYIKDLKENTFTKELEDKTNVHINWRICEDNTEQENSIAIASGDYADVFLECGISKSAQQVYGKKGTLIDLTDLIEEHTINIKKLLKERPDVRAQITAPDGKIYGLPKINEVYHNKYPTKMWVYKPWLDRLGLSVPQTTEEFYQMLRAFREQDPNGNGIQDEIPLAATSLLGVNGYDQYILNAFEYVTDKLFKVEDGKVVPSIITPNYREGIRFLAKLYQENLLYRESLTQDRNMLTNIAQKEGDPILGAAAGMWFGIFTVSGSEDGRYKDYVAIPPLTGPNGIRQTPIYQYDVSTSVFSITDKCKSPDLAIRWIDYFYSMEGTLTSQYGKQDEGWTEAKDGQKGLNGEPALWIQKKRFGTLQNEVWQNFGAMGMTEDIRLRMASEENDDTEIRLYQETKEKYEPYGVNKTVPNMFFDEDSSEFLEKSNAVKQKHSQWLVDFVSGNKSVETDWDMYLADMDKAGMKRVQEIYQKAYNKNR